MSIVIRNPFDIVLDGEGDELWSVMHQYHFRDGVLQDPMIRMYCGKIDDYGDLEIDKVYDELDWLKDFEICGRIPQVMHDDGLVYDDLTYKLKIKIENK
jgi:hypothetical protein